MSPSSPEELCMSVCVYVPVFMCINVHVYMAVRGQRFPRFLFSETGSLVKARAHQLGWLARKLQGQRGPAPWQWGRKCILPASFSWVPGS